MRKIWVVVALMVIGTCAVLSALATVLPPDF
jgi:hypothetical protein